MNKINNIQGLRGIAVLFVAFSHLFSVEGKYGGNSIIPEFILFGISGVDLFFVLSGFVMVTVTREKFLKSMDALKFIFHRVVRIYPIYWIYTVLVLIVFLIQPSWVNSATGNQANIASSFLLLPQNIYPLVAVGWSLVHEMYFYLFFFLIMLLISESFLPLALAVWGGVLVFFHIFFNEPNNLYLRLVLHPLTLEFISGCFVAIFYYNYEIKQTKALLTITVISFILLIVGHEVEPFISDVYTSAWWWRVLTFGTPSLLIVHCLVHLDRENYVFPIWLIAIGNASYSIYLSHVLVFNALGRIWHVFSSNGIMDNIVAIPVLIASMLGFGLLSYHKIEKPITRIFRKIA